MNQCIHLLYMFPIVGLHMFYSMLITLLLVNKNLFEFWTIWFGRYDLHSVLFKCLENLFEYLEKPLWSSSLICQSPTKSHMMILLENHIHICCLFLHWALSNCCDPRKEIFVMLSWSRFTCTLYTSLLFFYEKLALYHPSIPQNICSTMCIDLSLQLLL